MTDIDLVDLPVMPPPPGPWTEHAACKGLPVAIFFPSRGEPNAMAKDVCGGCVVRDQCRSYATAQGRLLKGYWGSSEEQREQARGERDGHIQHGSVAGYSAHKRRGLPLCQECRDAYNAYTARRRKSRAKPRTQEQAA